MMTRRDIQSKGMQVLKVRQRYSKNYRCASGVKTTVGNKHQTYYVITYLLVSTIAN